MARINFLFALLLLTACTPNATLAPLPTATPSPVASKVVIIDMNPAGFDLTDPSDNNSEFFIPLSVNDVQNPNPDDDVIPSEVVARDKEIVNEMNANLAEIAVICGVPAQYLKPVWKAHTAIDSATSRTEYRWTRVYEADIPTGEDLEAGIYTCWSRDQARGILNIYPTVWENGRLVKDGNSFERIKGEMIWAGTTPVIFDSSTQKFAISGGANYDAILQPSTWIPLETTPIAEAINPVANPFSPENMNILISGGYFWDATTGSLKNADGNVTLRYQDGKLVDSAGVETRIEALIPVETNGVDYKGRDVVVLTRIVNGEKQIALPSGEWVTPIDVAGSTALIDKNELPRPFFDGNTVNGTYETIDFNEIPEISWDDFTSGRLLLSEQLNLKPHPEGMRMPTLIFVRLSTLTNEWVVTQYSINHDQHTEPGPVEGGRILAENDGVLNLDLFKMIDPITGDWIFIKGQQYPYGENDIVLHMLFTDKFAEPNDATLQMSVSNPSWVYTEPIVSYKPGQWCGEGALGSRPPQPSVCALQGHDGLPLARSLLPVELQDLMEQFDIEGQLSVASAEAYPADQSVLADLQQLALPQYSRIRLMEIYLRSVDDPYFK